MINKKRWITALAHASCQLPNLLASASAFVQNIDLLKFQEETLKRLDKVDAQVSAIYNEITGAITLSDNEFEILHFLLQHSEYGLDDPVEYKEMKRELSHLPENQFLESCYLLKNSGLVRLLEHSGRVDFIIPAYSAFWMFDEAVIESNTAADCITIAEWILENQDELATHFFIYKKEWTPRRFNPAYSLMLYMIGEFTEYGELGANVSQEKGAVVLPRLFINAEVISKIRVLVQTYSDCS